MSIYFLFLFFFFFFFCFHGFFMISLVPIIFFFISRSPSLSFSFFFCLEHHIFFLFSELNSFSSFYFFFSGGLVSTVAFLLFLLFLFLFGAPHVFFLFSELSCFSSFTFLFSGGLVLTVFFLLFLFFFLAALCRQLSFFSFFPFFWGRRIFPSCFWIFSSFSLLFFWEALFFLSLLPSPEQAVRNRSICFPFVSLIHVDAVSNHTMNDMLWPSAPNMFHVTFTGSTMRKSVHSCL